MRRPLLLFIALALVAIALPVAPVTAEPRLQRLGEDPAGDGPPALDVTYLDVGLGRFPDGGGPTRGLEIRIGVAGMLPEIGGYPDAPGIEWIFEVGKRTFIAEGVAGRTPSFYLFELKDGAAVQLDSPAGTYDADDGFIRMVVPLKTIGAKKGSRISGIGPRGTEDVDAHIHYPGGEHYPDKMATTKDFVVP